MIDRVALFVLVVVREHVQIANDAYEAAKDSHALVVCTEWDEFKVNNVNRTVSLYK